MRRALHNAEARLKTPLPEVRALLTAMPVSEQQSRDEDYLRQLDNKDRAEQLMMGGSSFREQQRQAIVKLENLK